MNIESDTMTRRIYSRLARLVPLLLLLLTALLSGASDIELEGPIEALGADNLTVRGTIFFVDGNTEIEGPSGAIGFGDLVTGLYVEVEGELHTGSGYLATEIEIDDDVDIEGFIESIGGDSLVVAGLLSFADANTDIRGPNGGQITFAELQVGDFVELEAELQSDFSYRATEIEIEDQGSALRVEGPIESLADSSLRVNGIDFAVSSTTDIRGRNGEVLQLADLSPGDIVEVRANLRPDGSYLAWRIELEDDHEDLEIEGRIDDLGNDFLVVAGFLIQVDSNTVVVDDDENPISFTDLVVGNFVEVDAQILGNAGYLARRIELEDENQNEIELTGPIEMLYSDSLRVAGTTFIVGPNTVVVDDDENPISFSDLQLGMIVEVHGLVQANGSLFARRIEVEDFFQDEIEITGIIDSLGSNHLIVANLLIGVDNNTMVFGDDNQPISFGDLLAGMRVEVHALRLADGQLLATRIEVEEHDPGEVEVRAFIDSLGVDQIFAGGEAFLVGPNTMIFDQFNNPITFADLAAGMLVEIDAMLQADGTLLARRIKIEDSDTFARIQGTVLVITSASITVSEPSFQVAPDIVVLDANFQPASFADVAVGQEVTLWSDDAGSGQPVAMQIRIHDNLTGIGDPSTSSTPDDFTLLANYPNPFNPATTIPLALSGTEIQQVDLTIYNALGQKVVTLQNGPLAAGTYRFQWNGRSDVGAAVGSGLFFYRLTVNGAGVATRRMILLK